MISPESCEMLHVTPLRIHSPNYPAHWQEIQLPDEVVSAWRQTQG